MTRGRGPVGIIWQHLAPDYCSRRARPKYPQPAARMPYPTGTAPNPLARLGRCTALLALVLLMCACSTRKYTVDDGRKVNDTLLTHMRQYGAGERALRPAIARSADLKDRDCSTQWELPISVATSDEWDKDDRVAWVRALGVDERLTVIGTTEGSGLALGDKIVEVDGYESSSAENMTLELAELRDDGKPFDVKLASGRTVRIVPFKVCRGYARLAAPNTPTAQDYHWLMSLHPLQVADAQLTDDEALWAVLWSQGLSEEGALRMKTFHYGKKIASALYDIFTVATGLRGAALAAQAATAAARSAATAAATELVKQQIIDQATAAAQRKLRDEVTDTVQRMTQKQVLSAMQEAASNRLSLSGVARVGSTVFDRADTWAFTRMQVLQANPLAGFSLHQKLVENRATANAFVFDVERMESVHQLARGKGYGEEVVAVLKGLRPESIALELTEMPLASRAAAFTYADATDVASNQPFARGLIDGLLELPVESKRTP